MKVVISLALILFSIASLSQKKESLDFFEIKRTYLEKHAEKDTALDGENAKFQRWVGFWEPRLAPTGNFELVNQSKAVDQKQNINCRDYCFKPIWNELGLQKTQVNGNGVMSCIAFAPGFNGTSNKKIFAGAGEGGIWFSENGGVNWYSLFTDKQLPQLGIFDLQTDPLASSSNYIYAALGGKRNDMYYSNGVYRSNDGGHNWKAINNGLQLISKRSAAFSYELNKILVVPNTLEMFISSPFGLFKTNDRHAPIPNWKLVKAGRFDNIIYNSLTNELLLSGDNIFRSTDGGITWSIFPQVLPPNALNTVSRAINIQLSKNNQYLYSFIVTSTVPRPYTWNSGAIFKPVFVRLDLLSSNPSWQILTPPAYDTYDGAHESHMNFVINPLNANDIIFSSAFLYRTTIQASGPNTWTTLFTHSNNPHDDYNELVVAPNNKIFAATDGGIHEFDFINPLLNNNLRNEGLGVSTITTFGSNESEPYKFISGMQDCGINYFDGYQWCFASRGDGLDGTILENNKVLFTEGPSLFMANSVNPCINFNTIILPAIAINNYPVSNWGKTFCKSPGIPNRFYHCTREIMEGNFNGANINWSPAFRSDFTNSFVHNTAFNISAFSIPRVNPDYMYVVINDWNTRKTRIFKSKNITAATPAWSEIQNIPQNNFYVTSIAASESNPDEVWICYSGYNNKRVAKYDGTNWSYDDNCLPNYPANSIVYQFGTNDGLYIATDVGIYYKNSTMTNWSSYSNNLPNVICNWLELNYSAGKLRAGTYGRGLWEANLANFSSCMGCN